MHFDRRDFLKAGASLALAAELPRLASAASIFAPQPGNWRNFEITTRLEIAQAEGKTQAWIPLPSVNEKDWFKSDGSRWTTNGRATQARDPHYGAEMLHVEWADKRTSAGGRGDQQDFHARPRGRSVDAG